MSNPINYVGFTQNSKIICTGHKNGYMFCNTSDILENSVSYNEEENVSLPETHLKNCIIVERFFSTSLLVVVTQQDPRVVTIYNSLIKKIICSLHFEKSVLAVRLNVKRMAICLEDAIYIYDIGKIRQTHKIVQSTIDRSGIFDLAALSGNATIAYPGSTKIGSIHLFDAMNLTSVNTISAHENPIACMKFNQDGTMIATASTKGTVIRVFSVPNGKRIFEFRRGVSRCVNIHSLCFSPDSKLLASSSNTETLHVFKLEKPEDNTIVDAGDTWGGWYSSINNAISAYIPGAQIMGDFMTIERSFAIARLPGSSESNQVALISHKNEKFLMAVTSDGYVYAYRLNNDGGELELVKQHRIGHKLEIVKGPTTSPSGISKIIKNNAEQHKDLLDLPPTTHSSG